MTNRTVLTAADPTLAAPASSTARALNTSRISAERASLRYLSLDRHGRTSVAGEPLVTTRDRASSRAGEVVLQRRDAQALGFDRVDRDREIVRQFGPPVDEKDVPVVERGAIRVPDDRVG